MYRMYVGNLYEIIFNLVFYIFILIGFYLILVIRGMEVGEKWLEYFGKEGEKG